MPVCSEIPAALTGHVPVLVWTSDVEEAALGQLTALAGCPHLVGHVVALPDVHPGSGATVGSVFATADVVLPGPIGVDLGCGVLALPLGFAGADVPAAAWRELRAALLARVPVGAAGHAVPQRWAGFADDRLSGAGGALARALGPAQLGTLGQGNHFLSVECAPGTGGDADGEAWLLIHTGSRGVGRAIALHHLAAADAAAGDAAGPRALDAGSAAGRAYLGDLAWAVDFARESRARLAAATLEVLARRLPRAARAQLAPDRARGVDSPHNQISREAHGGRELWIHRKGAAAAPAGALGVVPGSMAAGSALTRGLAHPDAFASAPHGAGRRLSRTAARQQLTLDGFRAKMRGIAADVGRATLDEAPGAYRALDAVLAAAADLATPVARLRPVLSVKGGGRGEPRGAADASAPRRDRTRERDGLLERRRAERRARGRG